MVKKWSKRVKNSQKWSKVVENGQKWKKGSKMVMKSKFFLIGIFWIGRDSPPPPFDQKKKNSFFTPPLRVQVCLCHFWDGMHPLYVCVFVRELCSHLRVSIIRLVHFWDMVHPLHCVFEWGKCAHCGGLDGVAHQWSSYFPTDSPNLFLCI